MFKRTKKDYSFELEVGGGDSEIIDYLVDGYKKGKQIVIYGHSRGGAAAVRISNILGEMNYSGC